MIITEPTHLEFMESNGGIYRSLPGWTKKNACLHFDLAKLGLTLKYGQTVRISYFRRTGGFQLFGNWKLFRMWNVLGNKPNTYIGTPHAENVFAQPWRLFTEDLFHDENALMNIKGTIPFADNIWHREEFEITTPSVYAAIDGHFLYRVDDQTILSTTRWKCEGAGYKDPKTMKVPEFKGLPSLFCIQACYQDNGTGPLPDTAFCHVAEPRIEIK